MDEEQTVCEQLTAEEEWSSTSLKTSDNYNIIRGNIGNNKIFS